MARNATWTNDDGLVVGFGTRDSKNDAGATVEVESNVGLFQMILDYDNLPPASGTAPSTKSVPVPANSVITNVELQVLTPASGSGTSTIDIGFIDSTGAEIDVNGLYAALTASGDLNTTGAVVHGSGALVDASVGSSDAYISVRGDTADLTAGQLRLTMQYYLPMPDTDPTDPISGIVGSL